MKTLSELLDAKIERDADKHSNEFKDYGIELTKFDFKAGANSVKGMILELVEQLEIISKPFDGEVNYTDRAVRSQEIAWHIIQKLRKELGNED